MSIFHDRLSGQISSLRQDRTELIETAGDKPVAEVTLRQVTSGLRGVPGLVCDTSVVDPEKGLIMRGIPVSHLVDRSPEEVFYLLLTGALPDDGDRAAIAAEFSAQITVPPYIWKLLEAMPDDSHPMAMLSTAVTAMARESSFRKACDAGTRRSDLWRPALDDALALIGTVPEIAAGIYRMRYRKGPRIAPDPGCSWTANYARMLGIENDDFERFLGIATVVQSDHEGGHASALVAHTVGSVLADVYLAVAAGWNALAGPLHGLASQVCADWVLRALDRLGPQPSDDDFRSYVEEALAEGRVIPGYGHAVLRAQDPRYLAILTFGTKHAPRAMLFRAVTQMARIVPGMLMKTGKVQNPWPNVDAINGALFHHYGIKETPYYTVFFATALTLGFCAQYVLDRVVGTPIMRPRSVTTEWLRLRVKE